MTDNVETIERVQSGIINGVHRTWIEFVVGTASSGEIAVFVPTREELERGEGELAVEHLRRVASDFANRLISTRNAFRNARDRHDIAPLWQPLMRRVPVEGELTAPEPSLERVILVMALGVALGIAGIAWSGAWSVWTGPLSAAAIIYALLGLTMTSHADRDFARGAGLQVPIRLGRPTSPGTPDIVFSGPYDTIPQIGVEQTGDNLHLIPYVEVVDGEGRIVRLLTPEDAPVGLELGEAAAVLLRQADRLVENLENNEKSARRLAAGDSSSGV